MAERAQAPERQAARRAMALVEELLDGYHPRNFAIEFWDGARLEAGPSQFSRFTWHIRHPGVLRSLLRPDRQVALGEAFIFGDFDISGDILAVFPVAEYLENAHFGAATKLRLGSMLLGLPSKLHGESARAEIDGRVHSKARDRRAVSFHYDLSNEFYSLWLDPAMVYSCAYFHSPDEDIETAQARKLDYICRKLRLGPGERLLDLGCGWGGLVLHAARHYGVQAVGITLSQTQLELARERIHQAGLQARCEVRLLDYRDAHQLGQFDKLASVGMVEHVGESALPEYFRCAFELLKPGGVFLNHGIGRPGNRGKPTAKSFTDVYVFPDGELVPVPVMLARAETAGFEVRDLENLREHYFFTLVQWLRRLEANELEAKKLVGEVKYRIWRLYLAGSAYYFLSGKLDVYQSLLIKAARGPSGMPLTREDWYLSRSRTPA
ncbi:MAG: class I SAM-dependent methyltransferase [Acidobacteria bacterium]|nr:class I SAM-dependent methyltransferase [Acidobacteriota bacterium]